MARSGKKCLFEDDVRALLGMPQPPDAAVASDTTLQQNPKVAQMQVKGGLGEDDSSILGPAFSSFGKKLMLVVVVISLVTLVSVLVFEEMERNERKSMRKVPISKDSSSVRADLPQRDSTVVTKENWKDLQLKADRARQDRLRTWNPRARTIQEKAAREAKERERKVTLQMNRNENLTPGSSVGPTSGTWVHKAGMRPHSGAETVGGYGKNW